MECGQQGGVRRVPGSRGITAAGIPQGPLVLPILRALSLPPPPPVELALDEPRCFPTCVACQEDAVQGQEWAWFGAEGGRGHGMHPQCWMQYMAHSAQGPRPGASAQGHLYVQCPTCRKTVTGERVHEHAPSGVRVAHTPGREQIEQLTVRGSEPGDPPVYIPRVPRIAFPEHVNMDDGKLIDPARAGGQGRIPRTSSRSSAPKTPPPTRPPPRPDGSQAIPAPKGSHGQATGEGLHNGRNIGPAATEQGILNRAGGAATATIASAGPAAGARRSRARTD